MIEIKNLTKRYGATVAINELNLKFTNGSVYGILGASESGKSTLLALLAGSVTPSSGAVKINGFDMQAHPRKAKQCIGYFPQNAPLHPELTPMEHLSFVADVCGIPYERALRQIHETFELTGLESVKNRPVRNLTASQRNRLALAQALTGGGDVLLLDEPTAGLDDAQRNEIFEIIRALSAKKTIFITGRELCDLGGLCDRILLLSHGKLIADHSMEELRSRATIGTQIHLSVRGEANGIKNALSALDNITQLTVLPAQENNVCRVTVVATESSDLRDRIVFALADCRYAVLAMETEEASLEALLACATVDSDTNNTPSTSRRKWNTTPERDGEYEIIDTGKEDSRH